MKTVRDMLDSKGREVWSVGPTTTVFEAVRLMEQKGVGALTVLEGDHLAGIISERDCARRVMMKELPAKTTPVADVMTTKLVVVNEKTSVDSCLAKMASKKIRHLPVMEDDKLVGILAAVDVFKFIIRDQMTAIEDLESLVLEETGVGD